MRTSNSGRPAWRAVTIVVLISFAAASCRSSNTPTSAPAGSTSTVLGVVERPAGQPRFGGQVAVGVLAETDSYSPYGGPWSVASYLVANAMFDPLAAMDDKGIAHPYLAQDLQPNADYTEWTIKLRP